MKKIMIAVIFISSITQVIAEVGDVLIHGSLFNELTEGVATRLKFWTLERDLRAKAYGQLEQLTQASRYKLGSLLFYNDDHHALMGKLNFSRYIQGLSEAFDNEFERVDYQLLGHGHVLDAHSATIEEKEAFVNQMKIALEEVIGNLLTESSSVLNRLKSQHIEIKQ